jgi:putative transposase
MGLIWGLVVHPASVQDAEGAKQVLGEARRSVCRLKIIWVDAAYRAAIDWAWIHLLWVLEVVCRPKLKTFVVQPKRWIVERTFGWLNRYRCLSKDYERTIESSTADVYIAMIHVMIRRLA